MDEQYKTTCNLHTDRILGRHTVEWIIKRYLDNTFSIYMSFSDVLKYMKEDIMF